ncbi:MAG: hypothetical protein ACO1SX_03395 [Actinomycetota bacterium]
MNEPTVLLNNYHGLAIRNFGHTRFPQAVAQHGRLVVLSDSDGPDCERIDFGADRLQMPLYKERGLDALILFLRKDTFFRQHRVETHLLKEARLKRRPVQRIPSVLLRALPGLAKFRVLDRLYAQRMRSLTMTRKLARELEAYRPGVLLDILHNNTSGAVLRAAAELAGVKTCGFIQSWDKLTTKYPIHGAYDRYLVWSESMRKELLRLYPWVRADQVFATGSPQFDYYYNPDYLLSRSELCQRLRLDPHRPILTYTTVSVGYSAGEERVLELLIQALLRLRGRGMPNVVIRPRPNPLTPNQDRFHSLERLAPGLVRVMDAGWSVRKSYDGVSSWGIPDDEDMLRYTSLMRHTDVGLAISSTTVLEWLLCDRPVVNMCFNPDEPTEPDPASRWMVGFTHYRAIREGPGVAFTEGLMPALRAITRYLEDPLLHSEGRLTMRRELLGCQDGHAAEHVAGRALELAGALDARNLCPAAPPADPGALLPLPAESRQAVFA